jgi:hypothetical protein
LVYGCKDKPNAFTECKRIKKNEDNKKKSWIIPRRTLPQSYDKVPSSFSGNALATQLSGGHHTT